MFSLIRVAMVMVTLDSSKTLAKTELFQLLLLLTLNPHRETGSRDAEGQREMSKQLLSSQCLSTVALPQHPVLGTLGFPCPLKS